jgi:hypothetical protein
MSNLIEIEHNAQNYIKWNKALVKHFFNEKNIGKEIILYVDSDLISSIGQNNNLGSYDDFINTILIDFDFRIGVYNKISNTSQKGNTVLNRSLNKSIDDFPHILNQANSRLDLVFFNYIVFYISIYVDNDKASFYKKLNKTIINYLPKSKRVQSLSELDKLFDEIEKWSLKKSYGIFIARRIGALHYLGLLNYQVVLKPELNKLFENLLYKYNISIDDNAIYPELANKLLPFVDNNSLRNKLIEAIKSPVYSEWFLNRALSFDHAAHGKSTIGSQIIVTRKGKMTFKIRLEDLSLNLVSDTLLMENEIPIGFSLSQSGLDNYGYYSEPIDALSHQKISFKNYKLTTKDKSLELETIKINDVNFFIKTTNGYILTLLPQNGNDLLVLVRYNNQIIKHWESWSTNSNNIEQSTLIENNDNLLNLLGPNYVFYSASNIKKPYYKNEQDIIYEINSDTSLNLKKLGGLKININTYLDIGLPYFILDNSEIDSSEINFKVYRNSAKDNDIAIERSKDKFRVFINNEVVINEPSLVIVKFNYQNLEKSFDFIIVGTKLNPISQNNLFKFNAWGEKALDTDIKYVQGNNTINDNKALLNSNRHTLVGLVDTTSYDDNYFIYLLTGLDSLIEDNYLKRKHINKAIDTSLIYLESQGYQISDEKYSRTNLISNLCALGFLNKLMDDKGVVNYQLLPPALIKIEKAFSIGSKQVYQLLGTRSKYMIQKLIEFCENENIQIRYKRYNIEENNTLEKALLPEIVYLDLGEKLNKIKAFFEDEFDMNLYVEDKYHIGDSLNKFIASISEFESKYLTQKIPLHNQSFEKIDTISFPRIVESSELYQSMGQVYKKRFLEKIENEFYNIKDLYWSKLYVAKENNLPVLLMKKQYDSGAFKLSPNTYIPSKYRLPEIVYRAFCSINHGIPKTIKVFIKNANGIFNVEDQSYVHFDYYKFSDKENRRDNIIRIITGSTDFNSNQVIYCNELNKNMKFVNCSLYSNIKNAVIIFDIKGTCIAIISNYKELFINSDKIDSNDIKTKKCEFAETDINVLKVDNQEFSINQQISMVLENNFTEFNYQTPYRNIKFDIVKEEKIIIKEIC